jgi:serine phosphatase RsbU (regulator of sigma subunit)
MELGDDWALVLYTDGIIEGRTESGDRLDVDGLIAIASDAIALGHRLGGIADHLLAGAEKANGGPLPDDAALFMLAVGDRW